MRRCRHGQSKQQSEQQQEVAEPPDHNVDLLRPKIESRSPLGPHGILQVAHPFGAGVESDHEADDADGPKRTESFVHELQDLLAGGRVRVAEHIRDDIRDIV